MSCPTIGQAAKKNFAISPSGPGSAAAMDSKSPNCFSSRSSITMICAFLAEMIFLLQVFSHDLSLLDLRIHMSVPDRCPDRIAGNSFDQHALTTSTNPYSLSQKYEHRNGNWMAGGRGSRVPLHSDGLVVGWVLDLFLCTILGSKEGARTSGGAGGRPSSLALGSMDQSSSMLLLKPMVQSSGSTLVDSLLSLLQTQNSARRLELTSSKSSEIVASLLLSVVFPSTARAFLTSSNRNPSNRFLNYFNLGSKVVCHEKHHRLLVPTNTHSQPDTHHAILYHHCNTAALQSTARRRHYLLQLATDVLGDAAFGVNFGLSRGTASPPTSKEEDDDDEISEFIKDHIYSTTSIKMDLSASFSIIIGLIAPILQEPFRQLLMRIPGTADWKMEQISQKLSKRVDDIIAKRAALKERKGKNFVSAILNARDFGGASSELFTPDYISALAYEHLLGGSTSTSFTLASIVYLVSLHEEVERKLLQEIDGFGPPDLIPTADDLQHNFPYIDQIIKESMRFFTASPFMGREALQQVEIGGYVLPKEIKLTVIHLYRNYVFRHSPNMEFPLQLQFGIINNFKYGVRIHAIKRSKD
ncbi:hypothetical protein Cni_G16934 [Canna indica]|uniref:Cytochrome P450 n=1 Tax=Canna indica TaxID=4628 RepID=A0AAQ3KHK2_9LILI|nr:hypothetical protein Cni_G16934 [Canna indica]